MPKAHRYIAMNKFGPMQKAGGAGQVSGGTLQDTGWLQFNGVGSFTSTGVGVAWNSPGNALLSDFSFTSAFSASPADTAELNAQDLAGTPVPVGATIAGVEVSIERTVSNINGAIDKVIQLVVGGTPTGSNRSLGAFWTLVPQTVTFGGASDLWGLSLSAAQINATNFGFIVQATTQVVFEAPAVDQMRMKIHYII